MKMYKEYLIYYDCQYILEEKICELLRLIGIEVEYAEFVEQFEEKFYPDNSDDEKIYVFLKEETQELFYLDTYIHPSDTLGMYGLGFRCKEERYDELIKALESCLERYDERNRVYIDIEEDCLYKVCQKKYVIEDEVPGVFRQRPVQVEKFIF
ncbi:MAG: hypothetical protein E6230_20590 [Paenibacillus dendritiformis]|uniref:hypothetical protein n=1 Tax=uncultured Paenibacillus sp. TaxID=227322 RepID=UPI0025DEED27|nr:hypothetical protein [uncultured Paenibacillus sp.]MDU5144572.1 hypothetical protein [Paenibacillus dendritiformis]